MIIPGRRTVKMPADFVVFLIGMRINNVFQIQQWLPIAKAMPQMLKELEKNPNSGFLGYEQWLGRTTITVQYWESFEKLEKYAQNPDAFHYPAWINFNKKVRHTKAVGIWHETYKIEKGNSKNVYVNMPLFGLSKAAPNNQQQNCSDQAKERFNA